MLKDANPLLHSIFKHTVHGFICVDFFFIISGFFLFRKIDKSEDTVHFAKNKIIRLLPTIWFSIAVYFILSLFISGMPFNFNNNIQSIFLLNSIGFSSHQSMGSTHQAWFIAALFWCSLFYFYINKIFDKKYTNLIIWLIVAGGYGFILNCNYPGFAGAKSNSFLFINQGIVRALAGLGVGYFLVMLYESGFLKTINKPGKIIISLLEIYLMGFLVFYLNISPTIPGNNYFLYIIIFTILFYLFIIKQGALSNLLNNRISGVIGQWSYSIYIMHIIIFDLIRVLLLPNNKNIVLNHPIESFITGIVLAIIAGIATFYLFEKPVTKYLKKKFLLQQASKTLQK